MLVIEKVPVDGTQECVTDGFVDCLYMKKSVRNLIPETTMASTQDKSITKSLLETNAMVL